MHLCLVRFRFSFSTLFRKGSFIFLNFFQLCLRPSSWHLCLLTPPLKYPYYFKLQDVRITLNQPQGCSAHSEKLCNSLLNVCHELLGFQVKQTYGVGKPSNFITISISNSSGYIGMSRGENPPDKWQQKYDHLFFGTNLVIS